MIDTRKPPPILKCPKCSTLYGPTMTACSRCQGPLVLAQGPKRLPDVPFSTRSSAETYKREVPVAPTDKL